MSFFSIIRCRWAPVACRSWAALALPLVLAGVLVSCDGGDSSAAATAKPKKKPAKIAKKKDDRAREIEVRVNRGLDELTGGTAVRVVWIEDPNRKVADPFALSDSLRLAGWDSQDGGYRRILDDPGNYGRPLLTPGGREIVYTDKQVVRKGSRKHLTPVIHVVDWSGEHHRVLGPGFAVEVRLDPATGKTWVYALDEMIPAKGFSMSGRNLVRFPLDQPSRRETIWKRTPLSVDNFQLSRDGERFAALFPWPDAGVGELATGNWHKLDVGCWPSMAPDNSYVTWVFDGLHRKLRMHSPEAGRRWMVEVSGGPDIKGKEAYHPRWSNHPRFVVFTGPYASRKRGRNSISTGGLTAEVFVGRFSDTLDRLDGAVRLTHNSGGDFYPDVWIEGGEDAVLKSFAQKPSLPDRKNDAWPPQTEHLEFVWQHLKAENQVPDAGDRLACHLEARGLGRHSRSLGTLLDGGWFEADEASNAAIAAGVRDRGAITLQALITEWGSGPESTVQPLVFWRNAAGAPWFQLARKGNQLVVQLGEGRSSREHAFDFPAVRGRAYAAGLSAGDGVLRVSIDGKPAGPDVEFDERVLTRWPTGRLVLGDPDGRVDGRHAEIEHVSVNSVALAQTHLAARAEADLAAARGRTRPPLLRVRARLVEATEPTLEKLDTYHRMLVDHTYEVVEVIEGSTTRKSLVVLHWAVLDDRPVAGIPRDEGREYELRLEPAADHPEIEGELTDVSSDDFGVPMFMDVATPALSVP